LPEGASKARTKEIKAMKLNHSPHPFLLGASLMLGCAMVIAGCQKNHPDEKSAVTNSLNSNNLGSISVSQDQEKGVMTLKGDVASADQKSQAESLAKQAAPDYTIANEIGVRPPEAANAGAVASNLDSAIEDNFKAAIKAHENLNDQSIRGSAKNGTLVIKGSVKTAAQKKEVGTLAKQVPNVQQVVNELEVKPGKHSTPSS
jgi:hyperosmotically inducible periplasmic protein